MPWPVWATGGLGRQVVTHTARTELRKAGFAPLPLLPLEAAEPPADPRAQSLKHRRRLSEAEMAAATGISRTTAKSRWHDSILPLHVEDWVRNPAPFAAFLDFEDVKVVSASPERFLKVDGRNIETRPIKGTRPRSKNPAEDERLKLELMRSVKDRAENLMIIDLERNDLGRISEYGSVHVTEFMSCEEYATVFHLVSTVEGTLKSNIGPMDSLINCFPGGSITGAPKIRSMEIIEELEPVKRSIYTGSIGYISFDGGMDTSIVIRTFLLKDKTAYFHVGGGIVYDSEPEKEYQETLDKAKALIEAILYEHSLSKQKIHSFK